MVLFLSGAYGIGEHQLNKIVLAIGLHQALDKIVGANPGGILRIGNCIDPEGWEFGKISGSRGIKERLDYNGTT
jgi:hypothetical protein